jgi:pimeloyl-ACP methyl ester carboxylesterase
LGVSLYRRTWGSGDPVIALHPLGLESSAFAGVGRVLARRGLRTVALDLPGFGKTPASDVPLTAQHMAEPVIEMARRMKSPPVVIGISMGGRVALEAALQQPEAFRAVVPIAPWLPWLRMRALLRGARLLHPRAAERWLPLERAWPALRWLAHTLETHSYVRDDELAQAAARVIYHFSCPATRASFISAAREMALEPARGPRGLWTRLPQLSLPGAFVWGGRDRLVSARLSREVGERLPAVPQLLLPCLAHALNGPHHRCLAESLATLLDGALARDAAAPGRRRRPASIVEVECLAQGTLAPAMRQPQAARPR